LLAQLKASDVLMVTRLDRLARSTRDLLNTLGMITEKKAGFRSLADAWADTTTVAALRPLKPRKGCWSRGLNRAT
jgi:DNA invertase Pin-like site-specific DNA recombinase